MFCFKLKRLRLRGTSWRCFYFLQHENFILLLANVVISHNIFAGQVAINCCLYYLALKSACFRRTRDKTRIMRMLIKSPGPVVLPSGCIVDTLQRTTVFNVVFNIMSVFTVTFLRPVSRSSPKLRYILCIILICKQEYNRLFLD